MKKLYFIEYSYDSVIPRKGDAELVQKYCDTIEQLEDQLVEIFDNEIDMWKVCADLAHYAKDGVASFEEYNNDEMEKLISDSKEWFG